MTPRSKRLLSAVCLLLLPAHYAACAPVVEEADGRVNVRNDRFAATVARDNGGLIERIVDLSGALVTSAHHLYTDQGLWRGGEYLGAVGPSEPVVEWDGDAVTVSAAGRFVAQTASDATPTIIYSVTHTFSDTALRVSWSVTAELEEPCEAGFMAYAFGVAPHREWFANTLDGLMIRAATGAGERTFQSADHHLDVLAPYLGVLLDGGMVLRLSRLLSNVPFANVFMHERADRGAGVFLARLDGPTRNPVVSGDLWEAQFTMELDPLSD